MYVRTTTSRAPQPSPAGRCAAGHFDSGCDWDCDWEHGANVTNMGMKCASDKSNILTNFHVAAPHYHPAKGAETSREACREGRQGMAQGRKGVVETTSHCSGGICVFKYMLMMQHTAAAAAAPAASPGSTMERDFCPTMISSFQCLFSSLSPLLYSSISFSFFLYS